MIGHVQQSDQGWLQMRVHRIIDVLLIVLVTSTSGTFGLDRQVAGSLPVLGLESLASALLILAASILAARIWSRLFMRNAIRETYPAESADLQPVSPSGGNLQRNAPGSLPFLVICSIVMGWVAGMALGSTELQPLAMDVSRRLSSLSLKCLLLAIGYDLGRERIWNRFKRYHVRSITLPLSVAVASIIGASAFGLLKGMPLATSMSAGAGLGWYSMAGALALDRLGPQAGAFVFLTNLLRETLTIIAVPLLSDKIRPVDAAAMGGATSMDSSLPVIARTFGPDGAMWGLLNGTILSVLCPLLLTITLRL